MAGLERLVVVGASLAGVRAAEALREEGFDGSVVLVGAEPHLPYDRPPLSKQYLAGERGRDDLPLLDGSELDALALDLRLGRRAVALDAAERVAVLDDGERVGWDGLIVATGAAPRRIRGPGTELAGVHVLRTIDDADRLRAALGAGSPRLVVVGAGFIGCEVAATARERGLDVTIVEALAAPLQRVLGTEMGAAFGRLHEDHGVTLRTGVGVEAFEGDGRVEGVRLSDGSVLGADVVVVGIGVAPVTDWLRDSGLTIHDGLVCDRFCAAGPPGVYGAGDVARWNHPTVGPLRLEHWTNAAEQGPAAARNLLAGEGRRTPYAPVPFFWSDQYGEKFQLVGCPHPTDDVTVLHGSLEEPRWCAAYERDGRVRGVLARSWPRLVMSYRPLVADAASWEDVLRTAARLS